MNGEALLQAIIENPDDDTLRLVYAEWLVRNGDPERAEFIRVQCEAQRLVGLDTLQWESLGRRAQVLLSKNAARWLGRLHGSLREREFRRGFLYDVRVNAETLVSNAEAFFRLGPIHKVTLEKAAGRLARLAAIPQLSRVKMLGFSSTLNRLSDKDVRALVSSPHVGGLEWISFAGSDIGNDAAEAIAGSPYLVNLETIRLDRTSITDAGLLALARSPYLGKVQGVYLSGVHAVPGEPGARALADRFEHVARQLK